LRAAFIFTVSPNSTDSVPESWNLNPMLDTVRIQRRTLRLLFVTQIVSGIGVTTGSTVGALLAAEVASVAVSGLASSTVVVGAALFALPATAIVRRRGRRPSLAAGYFVAATGALLIVLAALRESIPLLFAGFFLFGGATAANLQARYAAVDLAPAPLRGRHLSLVVWATTLGAVAGPQFAAFSGAALSGYGVSPLAAPFFFSAILLASAGIALLIFMRPDPAIVAGTAGASSAGSGGVARALAAVRERPLATLGVSAMAIGQMVMSGVMAMTPVHIRSAGHDAAHTLRIVGVVLSFHIAGMYAFAPLMGWLTDRLGRRAVIFIGIGTLLAACLISGTAGHNSVQLAAGLMTIGLGWSATTVSGATLLSESVPAELRASAQGLSDLIMGLAGATAGALSGVIVGVWSYAVLTLVAAIATVVMIAGVSLVPLRRYGA
jgi:MFS family permease